MHGMENINWIRMPHVHKSEIVLVKMYINFNCSTINLFRLGWISYDDTTILQFPRHLLSRIEVSILVKLIIGVSKRMSSDSILYFLLHRHKELYQVALQVSNIEELQDVILNSLKALHKQWSDSMNTFREKFRLLSSLLVDHGIEIQSWYL